MHIVQMINALRVGGAEKLVITFARSVQSKDVRLTVITLRGNAPVAKRAVLETRAEVVEFHHRKMIAPGRFYRLVRFLQKEKVDIIHTHLTMANILGATSGWLAGVPVVTTLHNVNTQSEDHLLRGPLESWLLKNIARQVIAVGYETAGAQQHRLNGKEILVIPNAVEASEEVPASRIVSLRQELRVDPGAPLLLAVGRLEAQKGMEDLLKAFEQLLSNHPQTRLVVAGDGSMRNMLECKIQEAGLQGKAQLLGLREDIPELLAACDIFVSASHWEGLPVSILEAMAAGKPVAATSVGDLPYVVLDGMGLLVPAHNPDELVRAIETYLSDPECAKSYGNAARRYIQQEYNAARWVDRLLSIYSQVIQHHQRINREKTR